MHTSSKFIKTVPVQGVSRNRCQWMQVGEPRSESISCREMRTVQRSCLTAVETLLQILCLPEVEISHLGPHPHRQSERNDRLGFRKFVLPLEAPPKTPLIQNFCALGSKVPGELLEVGSLDNKSQAGWPCASPHPVGQGSWEFSISSDDTNLRSVDVETNKERSTRREHL